jgi:2-keto-4-pentenoate hydratase
MTDMDDARVADGLARQLRTRRAQLDDGATALGWKAGYGAQAILEALALPGPIVGYLTVGGRLDDGATIDVSAFTAPAVEAEIAVRLSADIGPDATRADVVAAIDAIAPAIELVDFDGPPRDQVADVLAGNIYHRNVVLGTWDEERAGVDLDGMSAALHVAGAAIATGVDPIALNGHPVDVTHWLARLLGTQGERLRAGEIIITGAAIPPQPIRPGDEIVVRYDNLGEVSLRTV